MIDLFHDYKSSVIGVKQVSDEERSRYGIVEVEEVNERVYRANKLFEKATNDVTQSNLAIMGRFILTPKIFNILETTQIGRAEKSS